MERLISSMTSLLVLMICSLTPSTISIMLSHNLEEQQQQQTKTDTIKIKSD